MPSSPKIPKETILQHALEMLIQNGYASINIKALAKRIGCSTQPISWHFGNMENFRNALTEYALDYANEKMLSASEGMSAFSNVGIGYIDIAYDEPNLFRYLYICYLFLYCCRNKRESKANHPVRKRDLLSPARFVLWLRIRQKDSPIQKQSRLCGGRDAFFCSLGGEKCRNRTHFRNATPDNRLFPDDEGIHRRSCG